MKIYFAAAIRGAKEPVAAEIYKSLIVYLQNYGSVLTEHIANAEIFTNGEPAFSDSYIYKRDVNWLLSADLVIAEVTYPSLGVGFEIATAVEHNKLIFCLKKKGSKKISAMISGCDKLELKEYSNISEAKKLIANYIKKKFPATSSNGK
ncbi:MAG: nucleoside 2-deoxyribosyltransferase [Ignavibacteria bacterium]